jgi:aminopeptidase N
MRIQQLFLILCFFSLASSCGLMGIHLKVETPKKAGKYPTLNKHMQLLAANSKKRTNYDVHYYRLQLNPNPQTKHLKGTVLMRAKALYDMDTIQVDLYPNLTVWHVSMLNCTVSFTRVNGAIWITPAQKLREGEVFEITIEYEGKPLIAEKPPWKGGMVWKKDKAGLPWCGVACESEGASLWWPNKDDVADEADSTDVYITVNKGLKAVSNGVLKDVQAQNNNTSTFHWHVSYPINNYNVTYYIGNFECLNDTFVSEINGQTIPLSYYVLPNHSAIAKDHFKQVKKHLAFYEDKFGPYPWPRDGYKLIESPYAGMEHQSAIAYGNGYKNGGDGFDYIILHETAHEWWGNSVSAADLADGWIHEGFASYAEALYVEKQFGRQAYLRYMFWQRITILNKRPVVRQRERRYFSYTDEDIYSKGSWVLHSLRTTINNDSLFFDLLKSFRINYHQKQILTEEFIAFVNQKTKRDYTWFFHQYLFRREAPVLEYYWVGEKFYYRWTGVEKEFDKLPVELTFTTHKETIYPSLEVQTLEVKLEPGNEVHFSDDRTYFGYRQNKELLKQK